MIEYYHKDLNTLHLGCEKPRAYFIPFAPSDDRSKREHSSYFTLLNGEWDFRFYENIYEIDLNDGAFPSAVSFCEKMTVPFCWQLANGMKYDAPNYINQDYPYPVDPPELSDIIPCGLYRKKLSFSKKNGKKYFLNCEGVASCYYLWVNGSFLAYSEVSHCTSEVDITEALNDGDNELCLLVVKHCTGSYMEDQDFFRLSGIFRDVYILERENVRLSDIFIKNYVSEDLCSALISCDIALSDQAEIKWLFTDEIGSEIANGTATGDFEFSVPSPVLWNPEQPYLYNLSIICGNEIIDFPVGIRRFEIKNSTVLLNGVKIKARGINRHDSHPETGYAVTMDEMLSELRLMKQASVNMIRTSHYPNDPRFPALCDRLGFMLVDEADLESHGMGYNYGDWFWDYWAYLCDSPEWKNACLDRAERLFERDKNHSSVVLWSLGNESGCGQSHRDMANYIRFRDDRALIHYENARLEYEERVGGRDFKDISDVESRMYASISYLREYLADDSLTKPFFYCEYVCSMSTGDVYRHWKDVENSDKYFGGCIWEWCDHAVNIGTKEAPRYRYGGDFGDEPNDNYCCVDGLVFPDRSPRPGYYDMQKVYKPFYAAFSDGKLIVTNRLFFTSLSDYDIIAEIEKDGIVAASVCLGVADIPPQASREYALSLPEYHTEKETVTVNVYLRRNSATWFAPAGFEIGFEQIILCEKRRWAIMPSSGNVRFTEDRTGYNVSAGGVNYRLSKITGLIVSIEKDGFSYLKSPVDFSIYRSTNYNNRGDDNTWKRARFDRCRHHVYRTFIQGITPSLVSIRADIGFAAAAMPPAVKAQFSYIFTEKGVFIATKADVGDRVPELPRFGIQLDLPREFENISYFGYGPHESYSDRSEACRLSLFNSTVNENFVNYIKPQECGAHYRTSYASVSDDSGRGLEFFAEMSETFCFNAKHFSDVQLRDTLHSDELEKQDFTRVNLDYKIAASSKNDEGEEPARHFEEKLFYFNYRIKVKD